MTWRRCPVCLQTVRRTSWGGIGTHTDSIDRAECPGSREPWDIAADIPLAGAS